MAPGPIRSAARCVAAARGIFLALGVGGCVLAATPIEALRPLGAVIRRPADVTPERHARFVQVALGLSAAFLLAGVCLRRNAAQAEQFYLGLAATHRSLAFVPRIKTIHGLVVLAITLTGAGLRLKYLTVPVSYDEAYSLLNFARLPWYIAVADYNNTNNHLLNTFLMHWCYRIWGPTEWALRLPTFCLGTALPALMYLWANRRVGRNAALMTSALAAGLPVLIDYSVNARGYIYVTTFAVMLDACFDRLAAQDSESNQYAPLCWTIAWLSAVCGIWAMPIMVYPLAGVCLGYVCEGAVSGEPLTRLFKKLAIFLYLVGLAAAVLYAPAFIFRGLSAARNPFVQSILLVEWLRQTPQTWAAAFSRWTSGPIDASIWLTSLVAGVLALRRFRGVAFRIASMFLATFAMMALHRVAPPPRLFVFLAPWIVLLAAIGIHAILAFVIRAIEFALPAPRSRDPSAGFVRSNATFHVAASCLLVIAVIFSVRRPVILDPEQRSSAIVAVPDAMRFIARTESVEPYASSRVLAPLPCDKPAEFYVFKFDLNMPVNGTAQESERLWLLVPRLRSPIDTINDQVVNQPDLVGHTTSPDLQADFGGLSVWSAVISRFGRPSQVPTTE